jgi:hypothetical protein
LSLLAILQIDSVPQEVELPSVGDSAEHIEAEVVSVGDLSEQACSKVDVFPVRSATLLISLISKVGFLVGLENVP